MADHITFYDLEWESEVRKQSYRSAGTSWTIAAIATPFFAFFERDDTPQHFHRTLYFFLAISALLILAILLRKKIRFTPFINVFGGSVVISVVACYLCAFTAVENVHHYLLVLSLISISKGLLYIIKARDLIVLSLISHAAAYFIILWVRKEPVLEITDIRSTLLFQGILLLFAFSGSNIRYKLSKESFINALRVSEENRRNDLLLRNILPSEVAEELKTTGAAKAKSYTMATVMFTDFKNFTGISEKICAELVVDELHACFSAFDMIVRKHNIEKIKTIGDAYMCASGVPAHSQHHALDMMRAAIEIRDFMTERKAAKEKLGETVFEIRIGIHTGPVVAGVVGLEKYAYDIWGDTVNVASRMEKNSESGKVNISGSTYELVKNHFRFMHRGKITIKNKGDIDMYYADSGDPEEKKDTEKNTRIDYASAQILDA
jgi:class 3 adenylate cyclase